MEYGSLIRLSWLLTWRYRFLWLLGLFAGSGVGSCSSAGGGNYNYSFGDGDLNRIGPEVQQSVEQAGRWVIRNMDIIVMAIVVAVILLLVFVVLNFIAQGAMATATTELASGRRSSFGQAWSVGLHHFWRYVGLWLLLIAFTIAAFLLIGLLVVAGVVIARAGGDISRVVVIGLGGVLGVLLALLSIPFFIVLGIVISYAQRAIVVENAGPMHGLRIGAGLLRRQLGPSLLVWLISVALSIGVGIAVFLGVILALVPLGGVALLLYSSAGLTATTVIYSGVALLLLMLVGWVLTGIANAFFWNYWSLAYLRLTGRLPHNLLPAAE